MNTFLPSGYQAPKGNSNYMKLQDGENKIRILTAPILGWQDWDNKMPVRFRYDAKPAQSIDPKKPIKHFWAMVVWNYADESIQILEVTQAGIRNAIENLSKDSDWGLPYNYDIKIFKKGEGKETEYSVNPLPHKPVHEYLVKQFNERPAYLPALFDNADPFAAGWPEYTPLATQSSGEAVMKPKEASVTREQLEDLLYLMEDCEPGYKEEVLEKLKKPPFSFKELTDITPAVYARLVTACTKKRDEYQAAMVG
jgi:hypothetical protein